jgi:hypothetical protein
MGTGQVLCVDDNGYIEIKTYCLPCCTEIEETCEPKFPEDHHDQHTDCFDCSDFELYSPIWSNRDNANSNEYSYVAAIDYLDYRPGWLFILNDDLISSRFYIISEQEPPSDINTSTVLRC